MMELTASQPVLINRGMLYLDWNLGDPTPWGHHLAPTSRLSSSSSPRLLSAGQPPCIYLRAHTAPYASSTRATFVTEAFSCTRPRTRPADAAFIPMLDSLVASVPSIFTWWLMSVIDRFKRLTIAPRFEFDDAIFLRTWLDGIRNFD